MTSFLVLIYLLLGYNWIQRYMILEEGSWTGLFLNFFFWPIYLLITTVSYLIVKPDYVIKEDKDEPTSSL